MIARASRLLPAVIVSSLLVLCPAASASASTTPTHLGVSNSSITPTGWDGCAKWVRPFLRGVCH